MPNIILLSGDGIGPEIMAEAGRVLDRVNEQNALGISNFEQGISNRERELSCHLERTPVRCREMRWWTGTSWSTAPSSSTSRLS